jgi:hypothetical protein
LENVQKEAAFFLQITSLREAVKKYIFKLCIFQTGSDSPTLGILGTFGNFSAVGIGGGGAGDGYEGVGAKVGALGVR